jgi:hypothetical protein
MNVKAKSLFLALLFCIVAPFAWGGTDARPSEVRIELSSDKTEYSIFEPVILRLKVTYLGNYDSNELDPRLERVVSGYYPFWVSGPFKCPSSTYRTSAIPITGMESAVLMPGDSLERDLWLSPGALLATFTVPGDYEVWIAPEGEWVDSNRRFESAHLKIKVVEPKGVDGEAFKFAKNGYILQSLMAGRFVFNDAKNRKLFGLPTADLSNTKSAIVVWTEFVTKFQGSGYRPYVLISLCGSYYRGYARTREINETWTKDYSGKKWGKTYYSHEPDYELLLQSADLFLKDYPNHPLAYEAHYYRFCSLLGLNNRKEAEKELEAIRAFRKPLDDRAVTGGWQPNIREEILAKDNLKYLYVNTAASKLLDLWDKGLINGVPRRLDREEKPATPELADGPPFPVKHHPFQAEEIAEIFSTKWMNQNFNTCY